MYTDEEMEAMYSDEKEYRDMEKFFESLVELETAYNDRLKEEITWGYDMEVVR